MYTEMIGSGYLYTTPENPSFDVFTHETPASVEDDLVASIAYRF
jgi:hypothetical protein